MLAEIVRGMKWKVQESYSCIHNYVESAEQAYTGTPIIRKGAISAKNGEKVIVPINMQASFWAPDVEMMTGTSPHHMAPGGYTSELT